MSLIVRCVSFEKISKLIFHILYYIFHIKGIFQVSKANVGDGDGDHDDDDDDDDNCKRRKQKNLKHFLVKRNKSKIRDQK